MNCNLGKSPSEYAISCTTWRPDQMNEQPLFAPLDKPHEVSCVIVEHRENFYVRVADAPHQGAPGTRQVDNDGQQRLSRQQRFRAKGKGRARTATDKPKARASTS